MFLISLVRLAYSEDPVILYGHHDETKISCYFNLLFELKMDVGLKLKFDEPKGGIGKISTGVKSLRDMYRYLTDNIPWDQLKLFDRKFINQGSIKTMACTFTAAKDYYLKNYKKEYDGRRFTFKANFINIIKVKDDQYKYMHASYEITAHAHLFIYNSKYMPDDYVEVDESAASGSPYRNIINYNLILKGVRLNSRREFVLSKEATEYIVDMLKEKARETKEAFFKLNF